MKTTYKIYGINSDSETCSCCGKTGLKKVVWIGSADSEPAAYGVNCAARILGVSGKTNGRKEGELRSMMTDQVFKAKAALINSPEFVWCGGNYSLPRWIFEKNELSFEEKLALRNKEYPIFDERLSIEQRAKSI